MIQEHITTPRRQGDDLVFDQTLRPRWFNEFIGQPRVKQNLQISIVAAKKRHESLEHVLLYGYPGLGKTTLAHIIAREMGTTIRATTGPALTRIGDLASLVTNIEEGGVIFIDEIHRLLPSIEEVLYTIMEEFAFDMVLGKGPASQVIRLDIPRFTLIGATTRLSLLSAPLRDRFGLILKQEFYSNDEIAAIIRRSATLLGVELTAETLTIIASRSRKVPRVANRLLRRIRDYAQVHNVSTITPQVTEEALALLSIDPCGLDAGDREILQVIIEKFQGGPVGLHAISAALAEDLRTIEDVYEPFLMQLGFLERTPRGRVATPLAYEHLGVPRPH